MKMNTLHYNLWDEAKAVFIRDFIISNAYIRKEEISHELRVPPH